VLETSLKIHCSSLGELPEAAAALLLFLQNKKVRICLFEGEMGAGKTTFIKEICRQLGVVDTVQSPTFSIVNEYRTSDDELVYHFDFYRIEEPEEAVQIGAEEYFYSGALCLIEWPSKVEAILPDECLQIKLEVEKDSSRNILINVYE
jgi:tRNA threonylcarbamoyladenosine biosynthesis protein TsaE